MLGRSSLVAATLLARAVVFFEKAIVTAGVTDNFLGFRLLLTTVVGVSVVCGLTAREIGVEKFALVGRLMLRLIRGIFRPGQ